MEPANILFHAHEDGRIERLMGTATVPASPDPITGVVSKDVTIHAQNGVSARLYLPTPPSPPNKKRRLPILVYYHGGGFCIESAFSPTYHPYLNSLACKANLLIVSVNYRLAPEHKLPIAYHDSWHALNWVFSSHAADNWVSEHGDLNRVFIAGDSAGGNIAHNIAMRAGNNVELVIKIEGMVLIHPLFWGTEPLGSETRDPKARGWFDWLWRTVNPVGVELDDHRLNATGDGGVRMAAGLGCRRVMVCVAEKDILAERGKAYYEALKGSGWGGDEVEMVVSEGEDHVFHLMKPECERASELMERLVRFFKIQD